MRMLMVSIILKKRFKIRPEIDRWILSELNLLVKDVTEFYEDYEPTKVARAINNFVNDNLSNWYVRFCRRRFWKGYSAKTKFLLTKLYILV